MISLPKAGVRSSTIPLIVGAIATTMAGVLIGFGDVSAAIALVSLNVLALAIALVARVAMGTTRPLDVFEPLTVFLVSWAVMFVMRPVAMLAFDDMTLRGIFNISKGLPFALLLAALGGVAFGAAYASAPARMLADGVRDRAQGWELRSGVLNVFALLCISLAALGGVASVANIDTAYVRYLPLLSVPGSLLLLAPERSRWSLPALTAIGVLVLPLADALAVGQRSTVLFVGGSLVVFHYLRRGRRPRFATVLIGTVVLLLVLVNGLEVSRGPVQAGQQFDPTLITAEDLAPNAAAKRLLTGGSTEMLPALALQVQTEGSTWSFSPGYLTAAVAAHWVPGGLWADKPPSSAELLYSRYFPEHYFYNKANAQFSILGDFYFDLGVVGVLLGMLLLGFGARFMAGLLSAASTSRAAQLLYSPFIPLFLILLRGDVALSSGLALYIFGPLVVAVACCGLGRGRRVVTIGDPPTPVPRSTSS